MAPTRELVEQIYKSIILLINNTSLRAISLYGGISHKNQICKLIEGVDIIVSTTGRILDFLKSSTINLEYIENLIVDEADRLLEMGFEKQLNEIIIDNSKKKYFIRITIY